MFRILKQNSQSVPTTLGGRQLGYLALVLLPMAYNAIPNATNFTRPAQPGAFTVTVPIVLCISISTITSVDIAQQKAQHDELICVYNKYQSVEQALHTQLVEAIP